VKSKIISIVATNHREREIDFADNSKQFFDALTAALLITYQYFLLHALPLHFSLSRELYFFSLREMLHFQLSWSSTMTRVDPTTGHKACTVLGCGSVSVIRRYLTQMHE
jgi:hypothetical protein